jgi:hypothetical protein
MGGHGVTIGCWRWRRIGSVMVVLASFVRVLRVEGFSDFRLDVELWVENSFMSERSRCRETPNNTFSPASEDTNTLSNLQGPGMGLKIGINFKIGEKIRECRSTTLHRGYVPR